MDDLTINSEVTMSGENATVLAGRYRIVRQLGQGGMGSVWLAEDTKLDGFKVAIKMLPSVLVNNKRAYQQVKAEALVSLKLVHPNIVQVRAFEEEGGNPFLVMDYIDGQTLDDYLAEKGKLIEEETVKLLKPVAAALDYAHTQGVVHRDVKPGNVMIRKDGAPFVLDFGIAREIQETMTRVTGKLSSGTLLYMSPEQLNGDAPKPAQDIYSFAAMAYECLKGEPPFSRGQVEFQILNKEPEPLPGGSVLARSILRGLAKAPVARPEKCIGVVAPVVVSRPRPRPAFQRVSVPKADARFIPPKVGKKPRRNAWVWLVLTLIFLAGGGILWSARRNGTADESVSRSVRTDFPTDAYAKERKWRADSLRATAQAQMCLCRKLDRGDGFKKRLEDCEAVLTRAREEYDKQIWKKSADSYDEVIGLCKQLMSLNESRNQARKAAAEMEKQARAAKEAEADKYAKERFDAAKKQVEQARQEFAAMRFEGAMAGHAVAEQLFEKSVSEARENKSRLARESQERKLRELKNADKSSSRSDAERVRAKEQSDGFSYLVGGGDLAWGTGDAGFEVATDDPYVLQCMGGGRRHFFSNETYGDFILRFEFCLRQNGMGGVGLRVQDAGKPLEYYSMGMVQLIDDEGSCFYDMVNDSPKLKPYQYTGALYGFVSSLRDNSSVTDENGKRFARGGSYALQAGEWNSVEIRVVGKTVSVQLNGQWVLNADLSKFGASERLADGMLHPGVSNSNGRIAFMSASGGLQWRNIRIKVLGARVGDARVSGTHGRSDQDAVENLTPADARRLYETGLAVLQTNPKLAFRCLERAAKFGEANAQYELGCLYMLGEYGVEKNDKIGIGWIRKAAEQEVPGAQQQLGYEYYKGTAVPANNGEAVKWFRLAAESGNAPGQYWLGNMYCWGKGVVKDESEAVKWWRMAAKNGNENAVKALQERGMDVQGYMLYPRPDEMNFCRHCRAPLTSYQKVPRNCPKCGRNLFGN